jgi:hypothetical protein
MISDANENVRCTSNIASISFTTHCCCGLGEQRLSNSDRVRLPLHIPLRVQPDVSNVRLAPDLMILHVSSCHCVTPVLVLESVVASAKTWHGLTKFAITHQIN